MRAEFLARENNDYKDKVIEQKSKIIRLEDNLMNSNANIKENENLFEDTQTSLNCKKLEIDNLNRKIQSLHEKLEQDKYTIHDHYESQKSMQEDLDTYIGKAQNAEIQYRNQILELH